MSTSIYLSASQFDLHVEGGYIQVQLDLHPFFDDNFGIVSPPAFLWQNMIQIFWFPRSKSPPFCFVKHKKKARASFSFFFHLFLFSHLNDALKCFSLESLINADCPPDPIPGWTWLPSQVVLSWTLMEEPFETLRHYSPTGNGHWGQVIRASWQYRWSASM